MVLETDNICYFNDIKSLNSKYDNMGLLGSLLPRCETLCLFPERLPEGVGVQALQDLREGITREFSNMHGAMVTKAAFGIKLLKTDEEAFTGRR